MLVKFSKTLPWVLLFAAQLCSGLELPWNNERIVFSAADGKWSISTQSSSRQIKVIGPDIETAFLIEKSEGKIEIRSRELLTKKADTKNLKSYEVLIPAQATFSFHMMDGQVQLSKLFREVDVNVQKGQLSVKDSNATLNLHVHKADIDVRDCQGRLNIDSYSGSVGVKNFSGDLDVQNFSAQSHLEKIKGFQNLSLGAGTAQVLQSQGSLQFELGKGSLSVNQFGGRVEGQSQEGSLSVVLSPESELSVRTQSGRVTVQTPSQAGVSLNVSTQEGELYVPAPLRVARDGMTKIVRGRLRGETGKSSVFIRSQEGTILIK